MAIIADKYYTLLDQAKQFGEDGRELAIAEVLSQSNDIVKDALVIEGNSDSGHEYAVRTGIPEGTFRLAYHGVAPEKATVADVLEGYGTLAAYSVVDKLIAERGGHVSAVRSGQAKGIVAGMSNTMAKNMIYGNSRKTPERFTGLAARYNSFNAKSARCLIDGGSKTDDQNTSIYLVVWAPDKVYTFFPKGTKAGLQRIDHGLVNHIDADGEEYTVKAALRKLAGNKQNVHYTPDQVTSRPIMTFNEIPVHLCDAIDDTEELVTNGRSA